MYEKRFRRLHLHLACIAGLALVCFVIYANTLNSPFVFDDIGYIKSNGSIQMTEINVEQLRMAVSKRQWQYGGGSYRPVVKLTFALNYYISEYDVTTFHLTNIGIHFVNATLIYLVLLILIGQSDPTANERSCRLRAIVAATIFAVHPLQTESVAYISQRMNSLAVLFYLLAFFCFLLGRRSERTHRKLALWAGCGVSWLLALGSKEIAATLPIVLVLTEWFFFQNLSRDWMKGNLKRLFGGASVLAAGLAVYLGGDILQSISAAYESLGITMWERLMTQSRVVVFYMSLMLFPLPSRLNVDHYVLISNSIFDPATTLLCMTLISGLLYAAVRIAKTHRLISFAILWFFIHMVVESSFMPLGMINEYRNYLPMVGFALLSSELVVPRLSIRNVLALTTLLVILLGGATIVRNDVWQSPVALWTDTARKNPESYRAHTNLGVALNEVGRSEEAIVHYEEAIRIKPDMELARRNLGITLRRLGRSEDSLAHLERALEKGHLQAENHSNLGYSLLEQDALQAAIEHFEAALNIDPGYTNAHQGLGMVFSQQGDSKRAIQSFEEALRLLEERSRVALDISKAQHNLGVAIANSGDLFRACSLFARAVDLAPENHLAQSSVKKCASLVGSGGGGSP